MKTPPTRLTLPSTPSGHRGRLLEQLMHLRPPKTLSVLVALALLPTGCFDPRITGEVDDGTDDGTTNVGTTDGGDTTDATTTSIEPDGSSGEPLPVCGDGVVEGDEVCDDGVNDGGYGGCNADCTAPGPFCGDGEANGEEPCDDGDDVDGNGCNVDCVVSGSVLWTVTVDGPDHGTDIATAVAVDSVDNIVVAGKLDVDGDGAIWLAKYTPDGQEAWSTTYCPMGGDCFAYDVAVTPDDDIIVVGFANDAFSGQGAWIRRYTSDGDIVWTDTYDGPTGAIDSAQTVITDENGYIYVVIRQNLTDVGDFVRKYTADGRELWSIYQPDTNQVDDFALLPSGNFMLASRQGTNELWTPLLQEMNPDGGIVWQATNDSHTPGWYSSIDANAMGDIALTITLQGMSATRVARFTFDGQEVWSDIPWGSPSATRSITIDDSGRIACTGSSGQDRTLWTRKYHPDGTTSWTDTYNGEEALFGFDQGEDIARDSLGNLIVVGGIQDTEEAGPDAWIRKHAP
jgi:hypothetical protein